MRLQRIAKKTLSDEVFEQLSTQIVHGSLSPGVNLPSERDLCETLGVNRGAVREALRRLSQAGLVRISQGGGTKVLDFRRSGGLDLLPRLLFRDDDKVDLDVARSIMEMRAALAPDVARLCARRAGASVAASLHDIAAAMGDEMAAHQDADPDVLPEDVLERLQTLSLRFWDTLVRGAQNIAYELAFNGLRDVYDKIRVALVHVMADEVRDVAAHRSIAEAVARADDVSAKHVAAALMEQGTRRVFELIAMLQSAQTGANEGPQ
ncbi:MAG: GntR family transcriptional regulator [Myxococcota bacterium]